jgi:drug/metabolite transporter (DMT)-like permease
MGLLIFLRVLLSVSANAVQKRLLIDRAGINQTWILTYSIILGPATLLAFIFSTPTSPAFWRDILIGGALDAAGNLAMVAALRSTDVSIFGPLNAVRPVLALLFGWIFLAEIPSWTGIAGIVITVAGGIILFSGTPASAPPEESHPARLRKVWKPLFYRTLGLSLGVAGAVFLKRAALVTSASVTVAGWLLCGLACLLVFAALIQKLPFRRLPDDFRVHRKWLLVHSAVFLTMQLLTISIFQETLLAYAFVFFQLGMVLQVFVGRIFFGEPAFARRLIASLIMASGSALILWKG